VHCGELTPKGFLCPFTKAKNRVTMAFFFTPKELLPLHGTEHLGVDDAFGSGIIDMDDFDMESIKKGMLEKDDAFLAACEELMGPGKSAGANGANSRKRGRPKRTS
jgi:hypothetical protein